MSMTQDPRVMLSALVVALEIIIDAFDVDETETVINIRKNGEILESVPLATLIANAKAIAGSKEASPA